MKTNKFLSLLSALTFVGALCVAGPALAIPEVEPNDTPATATDLGVVPVFVAITFAEATLASDTDVDFYKITLLVDSFLAAFTFAGEPIDTTMELFASDGTTSLAFNDDCFPCVFTSGFFSEILIPPDLPFLAAGMYFLKIAGFDGDTGPYGLGVTSAPVTAPIPEPASLLLLGSGLAGLALWRRKQA